MMVQEVQSCFEQKKKRKKEEREDDDDDDDDESCRTISLSYRWSRSFMCM